MPPSRPNFIVIGAGKCGTTSLCELLGSHPEIFMSDPKEPNFFSNDEIYARGMEWYEDLFSGAEGNKAIGEGSGRYTAKARYPNAARRIAEHLPECRLIYITRDPLERIESLWMETVSQGMEWATSFNKSIRTQPDIYVDSSNYYCQIEHYRQYISDEKILVLFYEDFCRDPEEILSRCFDFLEVDPNVRHADIRRPRNVSSRKRADSSLLFLLRSVPGYALRHHALSSDQRRYLKQRFFRRPLDQRPKWHPKIRRQVLDEISGDLVRFLERYGKQPDFWNLK